MNGYEWAKVCSDHQNSNYTRRTDLLAWADWELDRGDPFRVEPGLRKIANYWENVPRRPWYYVVTNTWTWTDNENLKVSSHLRSEDWELLNGVYDPTCLAYADMEQYPDPLAAFLDLAYVLAPFPVLAGVEREEYRE